MTDHRIRVLPSHNLYGEPTWHTTLKSHKSHNDDDEALTRSVPETMPTTLDNTMPCEAGISTPTTFSFTIHRPDETPTIPKDVPMARKPGHRSDAPLWDRSEKAALRFADEARRNLVGPMPIVEFLTTFLPSSHGHRMPDARDAFKDIPTNPKSSHDICHALIKAITTGKRCPSIEFFHTTQGNKLSRHPDISGYSTVDVHSLHRKEDGTISANLGLAELYFQVVVDYDPFCDHHDHKAEPSKRPPSSTPLNHYEMMSYEPPEEEVKRSFLAYENHVPWNINKARREKRNFGYMALHTAEACARQYRSFYFSVLIVGTRVRFFRWDHAGTIVTEAFDCRREPRLLCEFLWRFHLASAVQRGFDPTVTVASQEQDQIFKNLVSNEVAFQLDIDLDDTEKLNEALKRHYQEGKVYRMKVFDGTRRCPEEYLVSVPVRSPSPTSGTRTRGYWSVRLETGEVMFLKDTWRLELPSDEGSVYEDIQEKIANIPRLQTHGPVPDATDATCDIKSSHSSQGRQIETCQGGLSSAKAAAETPEHTRTQEFAKEGWVCHCLHRSSFKGDIRQLNGYTHYRLVLKDVGYSLSEFTGSRELFDAANDVLEVIIAAYERCGRLHRDISIGNIILVRCRNTKRRKGYLVDWEYSTLVAADGKATDNSRIGTWAFMSLLALKEPYKGKRKFRHSKEDDMESLFYVVLYAGLRWLPHSHEVYLGSWMYYFFDECNFYGGGASGGTRKCCTLLHPKDLDFTFEKQSIQKWVTEVFERLSMQLVSQRCRRVKSTWTFDEFRKLFDNVRRELAAEGGPHNDRVNHDVEYHHRGFGRRMTHRSDRCSTCIVPSVDSEASSSYDSGGGNSDIKPQGEERDLNQEEGEEKEEDSGNEEEDSSVSQQPASKRRRVL